MAVEAFFTFLLNQQVMSGWILECPTSSAAADAYLAGNAAVAAETVLVVADVATKRQLPARYDLAVVVCVELDIV